MTTAQRALLALLKKGWRIWAPFGQRNVWACPPPTPPPGVPYSSPKRVRRATVEALEEAGLIRDTSSGTQYGDHTWEVISDGG